MALTASNMLALGSDAPDFECRSVLTNKPISLQEFKALEPKGFCVMFICNHCPYVKHILPKLVEVANEYMHKGIAFAAVSSNDADKYPEDAPEKMKALAEKMGFEFPYLYDESQKMARAYHAACTPDIYLFDSFFKLVYRGQFDASRPESKIPVTGETLIHAMQALMEGRGIDPDHQKPSIGCSIKWKDA